MSNSLLGPVGILGILVVGVLVFFLCILIGRQILGPLNERAGRLRAPTQFQLSDFFWLVAQLQMALVYPVRAVGVEQTVYFLIVAGFLLLATVAMWAGAVGFMSRAGVVQPLRRAVFILFLLPVTLALMIGSAIFLAVIPPVHYFTTQRFTLLDIGVYLLVATGIAGCVWGMRQVSHWILAGATLDVPLAATPSAPPTSASPPSPEPAPPV